MVARPLDRLPGEDRLKCAVRLYQFFGNYDRGEKARREFNAFELMNHNSTPSPEPLFPDDSRKLLDVPGITRFVPGRRILAAPPDPSSWARKLAVRLAKVHAIPLDDGYLLNTPIST